MKWQISGFPKIDTDRYQNIVEFRNSPIDWGEFEGEKKLLLAIVEVLGERWEVGKSVLYASSLDDFDLLGFTFLWFKRYIPEVFELNPWLVPDFEIVTEERNSLDLYKHSSWLDLMAFNIAFDNMEGHDDAVANVNHHSSRIRPVVQKNLFWCYDARTYRSRDLAERLVDSVLKGHFIFYEFDLLVLLSEIKGVRLLVEDAVFLKGNKKLFANEVEFYEFFTHQRKSIKRINPMTCLLNEVMAQVLSIMLDAVAKFSTYDVYQRVMFDHSCLLDGFMTRYKNDIMNKNYYLLERLETGEIKLKGVNY